MRIGSKNGRIYHLLLLTLAVPSYLIFAIVNQSGANFLLVGGFADADSVFDSLLEQGILIRKFNIPGHLRITAGTETETTAVIEAITNLTPNHSGQSN